MVDEVGAVESKFVAMHRGEEKLHVASLQRISQFKSLTLSLHALEASIDLIHHIVHQGVADDDDLAVKCLGIRLFNGILASLGLLLRGYYQVAASLQRDLLETAYLLDYLTLDDGLVTTWRSSSPEQLKKRFAPSITRTALEKRDKYHGKRTEAYDLLCQLAAHPTPIGFRMLQIDEVNAHCGPFLKDEALEATLIELTKLAIVASTNLGFHFKAKTKADLLIQIGVLEVHSEWREEFYSIPTDAAGLAEMRRMANEIE